jgi:hypothetical protein
MLCWFFFLGVRLTEAYRAEISLRRRRYRERLDVNPPENEKRTKKTIRLIGRFFT